MGGIFIRRKPMTIPRFRKIRKYLNGNEAK